MATKPKAIQKIQVRKRATPQKDDMLRRRNLFLKALSTNGGIVSSALNKAKISRHAAYEHFKKDTLFSQAWLDALEVGHDELFVEARRRAIEGDEITYYNKDGEKTVEYKKSDTLLIFLMKQGEAQKKWRQRIIQTGNIALETVREVGQVLGLADDQIEKIQTTMTKRFDQIQLI